MVKNSKGYALVSVLIIMLVMALIGAALLSTSLSDTRLTAAQVKNKQAYYAARSGADALANYIIKNPSKLQGLITNTTQPSDFATGTIGTNASFKAKVKRDASGNVQIKSTGMVNGGQEASTTITVRMNKMIGSALFGGRSLTLGNGVIINGDLVTNASTITFGSSDQKINGNITLGADADPAYVSSIAYRATGNVQKMTSPMVINPINPPTDAMLWNKNTNISLNNGDKPYVKVNKSDVGTVIEKIVTYADSNTSKTVQIHLFVLDDASGASFLPSKILLPDGYALFIYYSGYNGNNSIIGNGNIMFRHVVVYAPNAKFQINGGGSGEFLRGTIVVGDMILPNSGASFVNDPLINVNDIVQYENFNKKIYGN
jgi:type II secretory pathway pseudopilin PulG